jgi:RNA polymerase sigma-70 factor (ECF subfamily)
LVHKTDTLRQDARGRPSNDGERDDALLTDIAAGDRRAFQRLMERHAKPMLALAQRVIGNAHDADEVVQETFLKVWSMAARWDPDGRANFSTWLYRVVLNASLDRLRRAPLASLEEADSIADQAPSSLDQTLARQRHKIVAQAMSRLPPRQQAALSLHYRPARLCWLAAKRPCAKLWPNSALPASETCYDGRSPRRLRAFGNAKRRYFRQARRSDDGRRHGAA